MVGILQLGVSMKALLQCAGGLTIELNAESPVDLFKQIAKAQEVFCEPSCGKCNSEELMYRVRVNKGDEFFEQVCRKCNSKLAFGLSKQSKGDMFPIRKITEDGQASRKLGTYDAKCRGWTKYVGGAKE